MTPAEYQKVKLVFQSVLEIAPQQRPDFLDKNCDDLTLRREVEKLLNTYDSEFMEETAIDKVLDISESKPLSAGDKIGHFEILNRLGKGGMGEVYLAHDKSLGRDVAIKVLLPEFTSDRERVNRFKLEAKAASALNHPNIITIYEIGEDDGKLFIATEHIKGETLADILDKSSLKTEKSLFLAIQIVEALVEAHEANIIHRDIKPSNIIVNSKGQLKVLDFGLAKFIAGKSETEKPKNLSVSGAIMGTVPYMSPEQLRGETLDVRTDIFSFGTLFYEMLAGNSPFRRESNVEIMSAILNDAPDWTKISSEFKPILQKSLMKDRQKRFQTAAELLKSLKSLRKNGVSAEDTNSGLWSDLTTVQGVAISSNPQNNRVTAEPDEPKITSQSAKNNQAKWIVASLILLVLIGGGWFFWNRNPTLNNLPENLSVTQFTNWKRDLGEDLESSARFSPDGKLIAFASTRTGVSTIWLKQISGGEPFTRKQDNWIDRNPIFSPDGQQIAFISEREGQTGIWQMPTFGGASVLLKDLDGNGQNLLRWSKDGNRIYFEQGKNLFQLDLASQNITKLTDFDSWETARLRSDISPDEQQIAFIGKKDGQSDVWLVDRNGGTPKQITNDEFDEGYLVWHTDGKRILYDSLRNGISQIFAVGSDGSASKQVIFSDNTNYVSDISPDGKQIIYYSQRDESDIWRVSPEDGQESRLTENIAVELWANPSPDSKQILFQAEKKVDVSRKIVESVIFSQSTAESSQPTQITDNGYLPGWSADGKKVAFFRSTDGLTNLWTVPKIGGSPIAVTTEGVIFGGYSMLPFNRVQTQDYQWLPDNQAIVFCARRKNISNLWQTSADGSGEKKLTENAETGIWFNNPLVSNDGQTIAFLGFTPPTPQKKEKKWSVWVHNAGKTKLIFESETMLGLVGWSESGAEIIVKSPTKLNQPSPFAEDLQLFQINVNNGKLESLLQLKEAYLKNIALSTDKQTIGYVSREGGKDSIRTVSIKDGKDRIVLRSNDARIYFASLAWSPDGKSIYFGKQLSWQIISMIENYK